MNLTTFIIAATSISFAFAAVPANVTVQNFGEATWFVTGLGSCGAWSKDTDYIVALSDAEAKNGAHCWKHIKVSYRNKTIDATVVDTCPGCPRYNIDLSIAAFSALASLDVGVIPVSWEYA